MAAPDGYSEDSATRTGPRPQTSGGTRLLIRLRRAMWASGARDVGTARVRQTAELLFVTSKAAYRKV